VSTRVLYSTFSNRPTPCDHVNNLSVLRQIVRVSFAFSFLIFRTFLCSVLLMCVVKCFPQAHNFRTVSTASCLLACDRRGVSANFSVSSRVMQRALSMYNYPLAVYCVMGLAEGLNGFEGRGMFVWLLLTAVWML
jgi:hypothetical protein